MVDSSQFNINCDIKSDYNFNIIINIKLKNIIIKINDSGVE